MEKKSARINRRVGLGFCSLLIIGSLSPLTAAERNPVDVRVDAQLERLGVTTSPRCDDAVFIRRVYLDMTGTLPGSTEVRRFLEDTRPNKRSLLIDRLFQHRAYPDYWAMRWCDLLRVKSEFPSRLWPNAVQAYHRWLHEACRNNMPYDRFARELLTASGSNFRVAPVNFYRAIPQREAGPITEAVALTFMGIRPQHLSAAQRNGMAACFGMVGFKKTAEWKEEIVYFDLIRAQAARSEGQFPTAVFPDGKKVTLDLQKDPRKVFADWLCAPDNPYFARCMVNRIWFQLLGRGIVHEPDDLRPDNPPSHPELLDFLARELVAHDFDLRYIMRLILNSETYQRSAIPVEGTPNDPAQFSHYLLRRLDAEVLIDALNQISGTRESYRSEIPEPFTFIPPSQRAVALADGSMSSPFLDMFGRPPRDTGLLSERSNAPSDTQMLHLLNSTHVQDKIRKGRLIRKFMTQKRALPALIDEIYLALLSRHPSEADLKVATAYFQTPQRKRSEAVHDLVWALLNSREFLYRH